MYDQHLVKLAGKLLLSSVLLSSFVHNVIAGSDSHHPMGGPSTLHRRQVDPEEAFAATCKADTFSPLPAGFTIENIETVQEGGQYGEGDKNKGFPGYAKKLPNLCAVTVKFISDTSNYRFGMFLPRVWNGRMLTVGGASFAGGINWQEMGQGPRYHGMVGVSTDTGHNSGLNDLSWGVGNKEALYDWGYRAMHGSVSTAKVLVKTFYGKDVNGSYYSGCSTGGRQGLKEIQYSPNSFDGALIGAPAWQTTHIGSWACRIGAANLPNNGPGQLLPRHFTLLAANSLKRCDNLADPVDNRTDNIISSPEKCAVNLEQVVKQSLCKSGQNPLNCLTQPQIDTAMILYRDVETVAGELIYSGLNLGSEDTWLVYLSLNYPETFDCEYIKQWVYQNRKPNFKPTDFNDQVFLDTKNVDPGNATASKFDISAYRDNGSKILMYQGLADATVPARHTDLYYDESKKAMGKGADKDISDFFRYFRVPGMQHCYYSPYPTVNAPWMFAGTGQAQALLDYNKFGDGQGVPGMSKDSEVAKGYDALEALMAWVESKGKWRPDSITATSWNADLTMARQRPICPVPKRAVYQSGDENAAKSWKCQ